MDGFKVGDIVEVTTKNGYARIGTVVMNDSELAVDFGSEVETYSFWFIYSMRWTVKIKR